MQSANVVCIGYGYHIDGCEHYNLDDAKTICENGGVTRLQDIVDPNLQQVTKQAEERWGRLITPEEFLVFLGKLSEEHSLDDVDTDDLYLSCACLVNPELAIAQFEKEFSDLIDMTLARLPRVQDFAAEVKQMLRAKLFVGPDAKIATYSGRGPLAGWVRAVTIRLAINILRKKRPEVPVDDLYLDAMQVEVEAPELHLLRQEYQQAFELAFRKASQTLPKRSQTLLQLKYANSATIDDIARIYRVHRATAARWLAQSRDELLVATVEEMKTSTALATTDVRSVIRLIHSQLDVSIGSLFGDISS